MPLDRRTSRTRGQTRGLDVEPLECRRLLSATVSRGILAIRGTTADDAIEIRRADQDPGLLEVVENGNVTASRAIDSIRQIRIDGGSGDDEILVNQDNGPITIPTQLKGGRGDDLLRGGAGRNQLDGGVGRNAFESGGGIDRVANAVRADRLRKLGSAQAFRNYMTRAAQARSEFGGWVDGIAVDGRVFSMAGTTDAVTTTSGMASTSAVATTGATGVAVDASQTNTQIAGVDEGDLIENDGRHLYILSRGELLIVDANSPDAPEVVSRTTVEGWPIAEYLHDGRLTVLSSVWDPAPLTQAGMPLLRHRGGGGRVQATVYDVADPAAPRIVSSTAVDGSYTDSRMVDGRLTLVVQNDLLGGYWGFPRALGIRQDGQVSVAGGPVSDAALVRMIRRSSFDRMLPTWTTTSQDAAGRQRVASGLVSQPKDVLLPASGDEANLTSILTIDTDAVRPAIGGAASAIGGYTTTIHMNASDLYLFSPRWRSMSGDRTDVQRFTITAAAPRLVSSGSFSGQMLNQFSADADGEELRVAVTVTDTTPATAPIDTTGNLEMVDPLPWRMSRSNAVYVLATQGDTLNLIGKVTDIAPGESIMSARFVGDTAYMVTFLQVDPLYTIDLSVPTAPRLAGELKVPGFSRFLQPFGEGYLLGVGRDADPDTGRTLGLKVSLFDVRDPAAPTEVDTILIDQPADSWNWSEAEWNNHALGFFPEIGLVVLPVSGSHPAADASPNEFGYLPWVEEHRAYVLQVDATGITELGTIDHDSPLLRTTRIGSVIHSIADRDLQAVERVPTGLLPRGSIELQPASSEDPGTIVYAI